MAKTIIAEQTPQTHRPVRIDKSHQTVDVYTGTIEALIAAGLVTADQIPGQPGMPKYSVSFYNGEQAIKTHKVPRGLGYLNIHRSAGSSTITVRVGICKAEQEKRAAACVKATAQARATQAARIEETAYRATAERLVFDLLTLGKAEYRAHADSYPFELSAGDADKLITGLRYVLTIFKVGQLRAVGSNLAQIDAARNDDAFQSFLRLQCIPADGGDHA